MESATEIEVVHQGDRSEWGFSETLRDEGFERRGEIWFCGDQRMVERCLEDDRKTLARTRKPEHLPTATLSYIMGASDASVRAAVLESGGHLLGLTLPPSLI